MPVLKRKAVKFIKRRLPILEWAPEYTWQKFLSDLIAGTTVALTVIPQALAYATLGGLQPQFGLYSAFAGCFVYVLLGSCKEMTIGPTALMALMTYVQIEKKNSDYAVLLCFVSGLVQLSMAMLNLEILIDFISVPVTVGFTSATSVIIAASQLKGLLGLKFSSSGFIDTLVKVYDNLGHVKLYDCILGIVCIFILLGLRRLKEFKVSKNKKPTRPEKYVSRALWFVSTSRNALVVIGCSVVAYVCRSAETESLFVLTGGVKAGFPAPSLPPFNTTLNNRTVLFGEMMADLGTSTFLVPIVAVLGNVAIAKAFANGSRINATQEMLTLSLSNVLGSFFSSMPVMGSFSRSAVNHASGVRTPMGGFVTGTLVVLAVSFLTPYFGYIPKAALSAVIMCAVIFMIEYEIVKPMWRANKKDLLPASLTFLLCLGIGVEFGILVGVAVNALFILYPSARPKICVEKISTKSCDAYCLVTLTSNLHFPGIESVKSGIRKGALAFSFLPVVIDCRYVFTADFTSAKGVAALIAEFKADERPLYFLNLQNDVRLIFQQLVGENLKFFENQQHLQVVLKNNALQETKPLLSSDDATCVQLSEIRSKH